MRVTTLEEYFQARTFIVQAEAIIVRANAEARELTGSQDSNLVSLDGLRTDIEQARKQARAFELVQELQARGATTEEERVSLAYALCSTFEIETRDLNWRLGDRERGLDVWMTEQGIGRRTLFDLTKFRELHPAVVPEGEVQEASTSRGRRSRSGATGESRPR